MDNKVTTPTTLVGDNDISKLSPASQTSCSFEDLANICSEGSTIIEDNAEISDNDSAMVKDDTKNDEETDKLTTKNPFYFFRKSDLTLFIFALFFNALAAVTDVASTIMISKIFDKVTRFQQGLYTVPSEFVHDIEWPCFGLILIGLGTTVFGWLETFFFTYLGEKQQIRCRKKLFESLLSRDLCWFESNSNLDGDLIQLNRSIEEFRSALSEYFSVLCKSIFSIISLIIISMIYSWKLTLLIMAVFPIIFITIIIFGNKIDKYAKEEDDKTADSISLLDWNFSSFVWIKIVYSKDIELEKFGILLDQCESAFKKFTVYATIVSSLMSTIALMLFIQSFWFGSYLIRNHKDTSNNVIAAFYSCMKLAMKISSLSVIAVIFQKANTSFKKVVKFLLSEKDIHDYNKKLYIPDHQLEGNININDVSFQYNKYDPKNTSNIENGIEDDFLLEEKIHAKKNDDMILKSISLNIHANKTTYIIGKSGSGKSTIANILLKLYKPTSGSIFIDGYDLKQLDNFWLRDQITLVQQFPKIFNDTIENNILLGSKLDDVNSTKIIDATEFFNLSQTINNFPNGFKTNLGKNYESPDSDTTIPNEIENNDTVKLSGGQEQRLNLIKAKLRNSNILILDESISALDIQQREHLMKKINDWRKDKTTIIITHELSHIRDNDYVCFMEHGEITQYGLKKDLGSITNFFKNDEQDKKISKHVNANNILEKRKRTSMFIDIDDLESQSNKDLEKYDSNRMGLTNEDFIDEQNSKPIKNIKAPLLIAIKILNKCLSKKEKIMYCLGIFLVIAESVLTPVFSFCFSHLINGIIPTSDGKLISNHEQIKWSMVATSIAILIGIITFMANTLLSFISQILCKKLQMKSLQKILKQNVQFFEGIDSNEISTLIMNDIRDFRSIFQRIIARLFSGVAIAVLCIIWTLIIGWKYALVGFSMFPLFIIFSTIGTLIMQKYEFNYKNSLNKAESIFYETRTGIKTIICLNIQKEFTSKLNSRLEQVLKDGFKRSIAIGFTINSVFFVVNFSQAIMFYYGFKLVSTGEYTLVKMLQIIMMILMSVSFISELLTSAPGLFRGLRVSLKLNKLCFQTDDDSNDSTGYLTPNFQQMDENLDLINFQNVTFSYPSMSNVKILKNFNISLPKNNIISIVGESGCGKSTIISLILRLYKLDDNLGEFNQIINIDGYNLNTIKLSHLMANIAVVTQKHYFFNGSIRENLLYSNPVRYSIDDNKIFKILKYLELDKFIKNLSKGLDSDLCKSGNLLVSGGQAQRLSIARAILRDAKIIILDECTSSLDLYNSELVFKMLKKLQIEKNVSILCITHQINLMKFSDLIAVVDKGELIEIGNYQSLIDGKGFFYKMIV